MNVDDNFNDQEKLLEPDEDVELIVKTSKNETSSSSVRQPVTQNQCLDHMVTIQSLKRLFRLKLKINKPLELSYDRAYFTPPLKVRKFNSDHRNYRIWKPIVTTKTTKYKTMVETDLRALGFLLLVESENATEIPLYAYTQAMLNA